MTSSISLVTSPEDFQRKLSAALASATSFSFCTPALDSDFGRSQFWLAIAPHLEKLDRAYVGLDGMKSEPWAMHFLRNTGGLRIVPAADGSFMVNLVRVRRRGAVTVFVGGGDLSSAGVIAPALGIIKWSGPTMDPFALRVERLLTEAGHLAVAPARADLETYWEVHGECAELREAIAQLGAPFIKPRVVEGAATELKLVTSARAVQKLQRDIKRAFAESGQAVRQVVGFRGGHVDHRIYWIRALGIWGMFHTLAGRYWNAFGTTPPDANRAIPITVEINLPKSGVDRKIGAALGESIGPTDDRLTTYLVHRGRIGGGVAWVGTKLFWNRFGIGARLSEGDNRESMPVAIVSEIGSPSFLRDVAAFVHQVAHVKKALR